MAEVPMPRLSDSMEEGTILRWLKAEGEWVERGEELVEIETDKANMVYEADEDGVLTIIAAQGETVAVGAPIAALGEASAGSSGSDDPAKAAEPSGNDDPAKAAEPGRGSNSSPSAASAVLAVEQMPSAPVQPPGANGDRGRISASPVARRAATSLGVSLESVSGTGPYGRIFKADVVRAADEGLPSAPAEVAPPAATPPATPADATAPPPPKSAKGEVSTVELSRLQQTVARRMAESKARAPHFTLTSEVDMTEALALRAELMRQDAGAPTVNDLLIRAAALALRRNPKVNGSYRDGSVELYGRVNVGVAVATDGGLVVPVIEDADALSLSELSAEALRLAGRVRDGTITPPELAGGTFTVSNLGMFGIDSFAGVINPPQAAILCAGTVRPRPVAREDGALVARQLALLTLVSDHRILYGADSAAFLRDLKGSLERPL
jgi:pyruvate dehydrogenase E2 component (dihydrolipoamide acetyltransferase)